MLLGLSVFFANLVAVTSFSDSRENGKHDSFINFIKIALGQFFVQPACLATFP